MSITNVVSSSLLLSDRASYLDGLEILASDDVLQSFGFQFDLNEDRNHTVKINRCTSVKTIMNLLDRFFLAPTLIEALVLLLALLLLSVLRCSVTSEKVNASQSVVGFGS